MDRDRVANYHLLKSKTFSISLSNRYTSGSQANITEVVWTRLTWRTPKGSRGPGGWDRVDGIIWDMQHKEPGKGVWGQKSWCSTQDVGEYWRGICAKVPKLALTPSRPFDFLCKASVNTHIVFQNGGKKDASWRDQPWLVNPKNSFVQLCSDFEPSQSCNRGTRPYSGWCCQTGPHGIASFMAGLITC